MGTEVSEVLRIDSSGGIVRVWHARSARDLAEADAILAAIDEELERTGIQLLLFDSRDSDRTGPEIQARIWAWLTNHAGLRRVATLMRSDVLASNVRLTGLDRGVRIRAFADDVVARDWLLAL